MMPARFLAQHLVRHPTRWIPTTGSKVSLLFVRRRSTLAQLREVAAKISQASKNATTKFGGGFRDRLQASTTMQYVMKLQFEALWRNHRGIILATALVISSYCLWGLVTYVASFVSQDTTSVRFQARSLVFIVVLIALGYLSVRQRFSVDPEAVYRLALLQMNTHPGLLEVMGAPLTGSQTRAMIISGGGLKMQGWSFRFLSRRVKMSFLVMGSHREGTAFLDVKKIQGSYKMKVFGVDVRLPDDQEQRIFLVGDSVAYSKGGILASLSIPLHRAQRASTLEAQEDELDENEAREKQMEEADKRKLALSARAPKGLDDGGGMYWYERVYWQLRKMTDQMTSIYQRLRLRAQQQES